MLNPVSTNPKTMRKELVQAPQVEMRGYRPAREYVYESRSLNRRIMLGKVPVMTIEDLRVMKLDLINDGIQVVEALEAARNQEPRDEDFIRKLSVKRRILALFIRSVKTQISDHIYRGKLEKERLKRDRHIDHQNHQKKLNIAKAKIIRRLISEEIGEDRAAGLYDRAHAMAQAQVKAEEEGNEVP